MKIRRLIPGFMKMLVAWSLIVSICFILGGCGLDLPDETIAVSGDLAYYAEMDEDTLEEKCEGNYIEVSGSVDFAYLYTGEIYLGSNLSDNIQFFCELSDSDDAENIEKGDLVTVRGKCKRCSGSTVYLENCTVEKSSNQTGPESTTAATDATTLPTVEPENTEPAHVHSFQDATCTQPQICTECGEISGTAAGHDWASATCMIPKTCTVCGTTTGNPAEHIWQAATCTHPKTCTSCGTTEGSVGMHDWKDATYSKPKTCFGCGATEGSPRPKPGAENYHGHVYTGGEYSERYHYEAQCAGSKSHEITWEEVERRGLTPCKTCVLN